MTKKEFITRASEQGADETWIEEKLHIIEEKEKKGRTLLSRALFVYVEPYYTNKLPVINVLLLTIVSFKNRNNTEIFFLISKNVSF